MSSVSNSIATMPNEAALSANDDIIRSLILTMRGVQVILDRDIAKLYGVETKVLNQAVKRNRERFPDRFMFRLTGEDIPGLRSQIVTLNVQTSLRSQIVTLNKGQGQHLKYMPYAFTEQGVAMLSSVLKSDTAIRVSIQIMDAFSAMRRALASVAPILSRLDVVERRQIADQSCNEERFETIFKAMDGGDFPPQKVFFEGKHYDGAELYHIGASLKDLGRKYCAVAKMDTLSFLKSDLFYQSRGYIAECYRSGRILAA